MNSARANLARLKAERDALDAEIKLVEEGIRVASDRACYREQLIGANDRRATEGKRPMTEGEFFAGFEESGQ